MQVAAELESLHLVLDSLNSGVGVLDSKGIFVYVNATLKQLLQPLLSPVKGQKWLSYFATPARAKAMWEELLQGRLTQQRLVLRDDSYLWFHAEPEMESGILKRVVLIVDEHCQLGRLPCNREKCVALGSQAQSLDEVCHDLKQPATMLLSGVEILRTHSSNLGDKGEVVDICYEAALQLREQLREIGE